MRTIDDTPAAQRFLMVVHRLSPNSWSKECDSVTNWLATDPDSITATEHSEMLQIIRRPLQPTEEAFVIYGSYADIPEDTKWDIAFDPNDPSIHESTVAILRFGVVWRRLASRSLSHGWSQAAVIDFPNGIPRLIESLPVDPETVPSVHTGLCASQDFPEIQDKQTVVA